MQHLPDSVIGFACAGLFAAAGWCINVQLGIVAIKQRLGTMDAAHADMGSRVQRTEDQTNKLTEGLARVEEGVQYIKQGVDELKRTTHERTGLEG